MTTSKPPDGGIAEIDEFPPRLSRAGKAVASVASPSRAAGLEKYIDKEREAEISARIKTSDEERATAGYKGTTGQIESSNDHGNIRKLQG